MFIKVEKWFFINLIYCCLIKAQEDYFREFKKYSRLITNVSIGLVNRYGARCGNILHSNDQDTFFENRQINIILKTLAMEIEFQQPILATTFKHFQEITTQGTKQPRCPKRFFVVLGWFGNASNDFAELTSRFVMKGSIWLVFLPWRQNPHQFLKNVNTPFNANMILARLVNTTSVILEEAYRVDKTYPLRILNYGSYVDGKLTAPRFISIYSRRHDLEGFPVRVSTKDDFPICGVLRDEKGGFKVGGYFGLIFYELAQQLNFTPVYVVAKQNITGSPMNGTWDGLIGMLQRNEIDFAAGPMTFALQALKVIDFVRPLLRTNYQVFFKQAGDIIIWDSIFRPFGTMVWYFILGSIIIGAICLHFFYKIGCYYEKELEGNKDDFSKINSLLIFLKAFCFQSSSTIPDSWPCRLIFITGYLTSTVLVTAYSAALISHLTTSKPIRPFDDLRGLLKDGMHTLTAIVGSTEYSYFADSKDPFRQEIYRKMMKKIPKTDLPGGKEEGIEQVCYRQNHALFITYVVTQITARQYNEEQNCKILHFTNHLDKVFLTIGRRKGFPFTDLMEFHLQIMETTGVLQRLQKHAWPLERKGSQRFYIQVTIEKVIQIHAVLIMGIALSLIIYIIEVIHFYCTNRNKEHGSDVDLNEFHERLFFANNVKYLNYKKNCSYDSDNTVKHRKNIFIH